MPKFPRLDRVIAPAPSIQATGANDIVIELGDNAGAKDLSIKDSDGAEVATINSDGKVTSKAIEI